MTGAVYRAFAADGRLLYIGSSANAAKRIKTHQSRAPWRGDVARWLLEEYPTIELARAAEWAAIGAESPERNVAGKRMTAASRAELRMAVAREYIRILTESPPPPPLSADQRARLAALLLHPDGRQAS